MDDTLEKTVARRAALSLVIPVFNEAGNVAPLMVEVAQVLHATDAAWEVLFVDDASTDGTLAELRTLAGGQGSVRVLSLARQAGQSLALWAGLRAALGSSIVTLDGDGQNDPRDIPRLLAALDSADMVVGFRKRRCDPLVKRLFAGLANLARNFLTGSRLPDSGCGLRAFRRELLDCFLPFDGLHRFLPTMAEMAGYRVKSLEVNHRPRRRGRSKYGILDRLAGPLLDCLMLRRLKKRKLRAIACTELHAPPAGAHLLTVGPTSDNEVLDA
ncbi:MAG: glycosyltransferase family 2 protein [Pirellulaceae bacterium]